jgi:hypothetical protein
MHMRKPPEESVITLSSGGTAKSISHTVLIYHSGKKISSFWQESSMILKDSAKARDFQ